MGVEAIWSYPYEPLGDLALFHFEHLTEASGIRQEMLLVARPFSLKGRFVREHGLKEKLLDRLNLPRGYEHDLLIFPYPGYGDAFRVRFDVPIKTDKGQDIRYKQPAKQRNIPYVLPALNQTYTQLFVTEGEKKTMALAQAGCRVLGIGGVWNWRDRVSPTGVIPDFESYALKDETVVIVFDSDVHSNKHVQQAEDALVDFCLDLGAVRVLRVRIPQTAGDKIGIDDYLRDHGWAELDTLLEQSLEEIGVTTAEMILSREYLPTTMLTAFLPERGLVLVAGVPGCGKTEFLIHQAIHAITHGPALYFLNEGGPYNLQQRLRAYSPDRGGLRALKCALWRELNLSDGQGLLRFERILKTHNPKLVILDPGPDAFEEENDAAALKEPLRRLYHLSETYRVCVVLSWHFAKMMPQANVYAFRGSSAIAGKVDLVYDITISGQQRMLKLDKLRLDCNGLRQGQRWIIDRTDDEGRRDLRFIDVDVVSAERKTRRQMALSGALQRFNQGERYPASEIRAAIAEALGEKTSVDSARRILGRWVKIGCFDLLEPSKGKRPAVYLRTDKEFDAEE